MWLEIIFVLITFNKKKKTSQHFWNSVCNMDVIGDQKLFGYSLQNIFFCVQHKKQSLFGLVQLKESKWFFHFWVNYPFN